jgi:hypothetical protein
MKANKQADNITNRMLKIIFEGDPGYIVDIMNRCLNDNMILEN